MRILGILTLFSLLACSEKNQEDGPVLNAEGGFSDILVISPKKEWKSDLAEDFKLIFQQESPGLLSPEPEFDLTHVSASKFTDIYKTQRCIIRCEIKNGAASSVKYKMGKYAKQQLYIKLTAGSLIDLRNLLLQYMETLRNKVRVHRDAGMQRYLVQNASKHKSKKISDDFKIAIPIPSSFDLVRKEGSTYYFGKKSKALCNYGQKSRCDYQMGWLIHELDYSDKKQFSQVSILALKDSLTKEFIRGGKEGQYLEVDTGFVHVEEDKKVDGKVFKTVKSWWTMKNGTMGGPSCSSLIVDKKRQKLIFQDAFFYGPKIKKRPFVLELEGMVTSIKLLNN